MNENEISYIANTQNLNTLCSGVGFRIINNEEWNHVFLVLRPPFLFIYEKENGNIIDILVLMNFIAIKHYANNISHNLLNYNNHDEYKTLKKVAITLIRDGVSILTFAPTDITSTTWMKYFNDFDMSYSKKNILNDSSSAVTGRLAEPSKHLKSPKRLVAKLCAQQECEEFETNRKVLDLKEEVKRLKVQISSINDSSKEILEQSNIELIRLKKQNQSVSEDLKCYESENIKLKKDLYNCEKRLLTCQTELNTLKDQTNQLEAVIKNVKSHNENDKSDDSKFYTTEAQVTRIIKENESLKKELQECAEHYQSLNEDFTNKINMLKELLEAMDIFSLMKLKFMLACCFIYGIKNLPELSSDDEGELFSSIVKLQKDIYFQETETRSKYLNYRSILLSHQLKTDSSALKFFSYFDCIQKVNISVINNDKFKQILYRYHDLLYDFQYQKREDQPLWSQYIQSPQSLCNIMTDPVYQSYPNFKYYVNLMIPPESLLLGIELTHSKYCFNCYTNKTFSNVSPQNKKELNTNI